jgi:hypothetical protein
MIDAPREQWLIDLYAYLREIAGEAYEPFIAERSRQVRIWMSEYARAYDQDEVLDCLIGEFERWEAGEPSYIV